MRLFDDLHSVFFSTPGTKRFLQSGKEQTYRGFTLQASHRRHAIEGGQINLDLAEGLVACGILEVTMAMGLITLPSDIRSGEISRAASIVRGIRNQPKLLLSFVDRLHGKPCVDFLPSRRDFQAFKNMLEIYLSIQGSLHTSRTLYALAWPAQAITPGSSFPLDLPVDRKSERTWMAVDHAMQLAFSVDQLLRSVEDRVIQSALFSILAIPFYGTQSFDSRIALRIWSSMARFAGVSQTDESWKQVVAPVRGALMRLLSGHYLTAYRLKWADRATTVRSVPSHVGRRIFHGFGEKEPENSLVGAYMTSSESPVSSDNNLISRVKVR